MKIIDEKGRLFGKINIIDFLVIVFFVCLSPMFYYGYKIFINPAAKIGGPPKQETTVDVPMKYFIDIIDIEEKFDLINLTPDIAKIVAIGDTEKDKDGEVVAEIIAMGEPHAQVYELDIGTGKKISKEDPSLKHIPVVLRLKAEKKGNNLFYKDKQINLNSPIDFITDKYKSEAILVLPPSAESKDKETEGLERIRFESEKMALNDEIAEIKRRLDDEIMSVKKRLGKIELSLEEITVEFNNKREERQ